MAFRIIDGRDKAFLLHLMVNIDTINSCIYPQRVRLVQLMITISPTASDWQSETNELAIRRDGLKKSPHMGTVPLCL